MRRKSGNVRVDESTWQVVDLAEPGGIRVHQDSHDENYKQQCNCTVAHRRGRAHAARTHSLSQWELEHSAWKRVHFGGDLAVQDREPQATNKACEAHRQRMGYSKLQLDCF